MDLCKFANLKYKEHLNAILNENMDYILEKAHMEEFYVKEVIENTKIIEDVDFDSIYIDEEAKQALLKSLENIDIRLIENENLSL